MRLHRFPGGLRLDGHKAESTALPIRRCALAPTLVLPLLQASGARANACVAIGQTVRRGERIAEGDGDRGTHLHAPACGRVIAVESRALPHASGLSGPCLILQTDARDEQTMLAPIPDWRGVQAQVLRERIREAGIVGLGGAAFPTAEKLDSQRHTLILNGAECEPWIACDDRLLRERAAEVVLGGRVLGRAAEAGRVWLAVEDTMLDAIQAVSIAIERHGEAEVELVVVPTLYPEGGERQLIRTLTGREVPSGGLPRDIGVLVQNVATAAAAWRAIEHGEALTSRIVTVTGPGITSAGNFEVALGTPISHLVAQAGGYAECADRLIVGGPLMGMALPHDDFPVLASSNCILVLDAPGPTVAAPQLPCIRCGECAHVCPARLLPQQLHHFLRGDDSDRARDYGLFDCIECGCCDLVCPSQIPLVQQFRWGKSQLRANASESRLAEAARERHDARGVRLQREAQERADKQVAHQARIATTNAAQAAVERANERATERRGHGDGEAP